MVFTFLCRELRGPITVLTIKYAPGGILFMWISRGFAPVAVMSPTGRSRDKRLVPKDQSLSHPHQTCRFYPNKNLSVDYYIYITEL